MTTTGSVSGLVGMVLDELRLLFKLPMESLPSIVVALDEVLR